MIKLVLTESFMELKAGEEVTIREDQGINVNDEGGGWNLIPAKILKAVEAEPMQNSNPGPGLITVHQKMKTLNIEFE